MGALKFGPPFFDGRSIAVSSFTPGRISLTLGMLIMERDQEIQEMDQMEVQEADQEVGGLGGDPGAGPSGGPSGGPPSGLDRPDGPPDRGDYGGDGDAADVAVEVREELVDDRTAFDPSEYDIRQAMIKPLNYNPKY